MLRSLLKARLRAWINRVGGDLPGVQQDALKRCLQVVKKSRLMRDLEIDEGINQDDFRRQVSVSDYDFFHPYIRDEIAGKRGSMFAPDVELKFLALTSGTTGPRKYIPVTDRSAAAFRAAWKRWGLSLYQNFPKLIRFPVLHLCSDWRQEFLGPGKIPCGDSSGFMASIQPWYVRAFYRLPPAIEQISDQRQKYYLILRFALMQKDVQFISTATPTTLISLADWSKEWREPLIKDIHDGSLTKMFDWPLAVKEELSRNLRKHDQMRARFLQKLSDQGGDAFSPKNFWPDLKVLAVWTGGPMKHYRNALCRRFGDVAFFDVGYTASEGVMSFPLSPNTSVGIPHAEDYFFEFCPAGEQMGKKTLLLHQLEPGKEYGVIISNQAGLLRYRMHDQVLCEGYERGLPLFSFLNKDRHVTDLTGEKLSALQVSAALRHMQDKIGVGSEECCLIPQREWPVHYVLLVERSRHSLKVTDQAIAAAFEQALEAQNFIYAEHRQVNKIAPIKLLGLKPGSWEKLREFRLAKTGGSLEQYKHPCLVTEDDDIGFLLRMRVESHEF